MKILEYFGNRKSSYLISNINIVTKNTSKMVELKLTYKIRSEINKIPINV